MIGAIIGQQQQQQQPERKLLVEGTCHDASFDIIDHGWTDEYRGWYDINGCGLCNRYCRWVGNSGSGGDPSTNHNLSSDNSWWSCQTGTEGEEDIWPRYDQIGDSFEFVKCGEKTERTQPLSAVSPKPPQNFDKTQADGLHPDSAYGALFARQTMTIGSEDYINPGQFTVMDLN